MARKNNNNNKKNLKGFPKASFARLVREIGNDVKSDLLWDSKAFQALQEASEQMLEQRFDRAGRLARSVTLLGYELTTRTSWSPSGPCSTISSKLSRISRILGTRSSE
ncbi:MAG: hypothetical protein EBR81_09130 [Proteobacteria bacterium]|nr:hypothetical protein [Pseudomonadota bacterium]